MKKNTNLSAKPSDEWLSWICASKDVDELRGKYDQWADHYDSQVSQLWERVPETAALMLAEYIQDKETHLIDVGAGTGLGGVALAAQGFKRITAIDLSSEMLNKAREKGVYESLLCCAIKDETFSALGQVQGIIALGVFAENHAGPDELIALQKHLLPQGVIVFTSRRSFLPILASIINQHTWRKLSAKVIPVYDDPIHLLAYQINSL